VSTNRIQTRAIGVRPLSSVLKTLAVLDTLGASSSSLRLADVVGAVGGNRGAVYQKLLTLCEAGWVEHGPDGRYRLSLHANRVGQAALAQASLGERADPLLQALVFETHETASLALLDGNEAYIARRVEAAGVLRAELRVGTPLRLATSASGRVLCAYADAPRLQYLRQSGVKLPGDALMVKVRRDGYAVSSGLDFTGVRAIAAPVLDARDSCVAALSLVAPQARFDETRMRGPLLRAARQIHVLLAGASP
jgi:IclR family KDG regulon transcriptional repressor